MAFYYLMLDGFGTKLAKALTSKTALVIYIVLVLALIIALVCFVLKNDRRRSDDEVESLHSGDGVRSDELKEATKQMEQKLEKLSGDINNLMNGVTSGAPPQITNKPTGASRFYMLSEIDRQYEEYERPDYDDAVTLKELCEDFRRYSASKLKLYYDIDDIRRFIGAMAVTKLIILQGMSGTGKTSLAYAFGEYIQNSAVIVPIQPMWKERTDLLGYYNEFTQKFNETTLLTKMYEANENDEIYVTVLDEMNIARVEYYFAEFLSLLEIPNSEGRNIDVVADRWADDPKLLQADGKLRLPDNMWFIGTANNDDSTFAISDKVYDRAMVINLDRKATPFEAEGEPIKISASHLKELMERAQREYALTDRNKRRLKKLDEYMIKTYKVTFGNRIMKQIESYVPVTVACGGSELAALDDVLSRKIFRKLEGKNPVYVKQTAEATCEYLDGLFGENKLPQCKEALRFIEQNN